MNHAKEKPPYHRQFLDCRAVGRLRGVGHVHHRLTGRQVAGRRPQQGGWKAKTRRLGPRIRRRWWILRRGAELRHARWLRPGQLHRVRFRGIRLRAPSLPHARAHGHDDHQERAGAATVPGDRREARPVPGGRPVPGRGAQTVPGGRAQAVPRGCRKTVSRARGQTIPGACAPAVRRARGQARRRPGAAPVPGRRPPTVSRRRSAASLPQAAVLRPRPVVD